MKVSHVKIFVVQLLCLILIANLTCANANDSIASVGVGGITLLKSENIRMVQEELEISPSHIRVHYHFLNESKNDLKATIAFPMPSYTSPNPYEDDPYNKPLRSFSTYIGGRAVPTTLERKAIQKNTDITKDLREIGLTEQQIFENFALCGEPGEEPKRCGLTKQQEVSLEEKQISHWRVEETALWDYVFPAKKMVEVFHEYQPHTGESYFVPLQYGKDMFVEGGVKNVSPDCDGNEGNAMLARIKSLAKKGAKTVRVSVTEVSYILLSGNNWKGPIANFKLRIKKNYPDQIVSICFPGKPKRIDNSVFEFSQQDFVPQNNLTVQFLTITATDNP